MLDSILFRGCEHYTPGGNLRNLCSWLLCRAHRKCVCEIFCFFLLICIQNVYINPKLSIYCVNTLSACVFVVHTFHSCLYVGTCSDIQWLQSPDLEHFEFVCLVRATASAQVKSKQQFRSTAVYGIFYPIYLATHPAPYPLSLSHFSV